MQPLIANAKKKTDDNVTYPVGPPRQAVLPRFVDG